MNEKKRKILITFFLIFVSLFLVSVSCRDIVWPIMDCLSFSVVLPVIGLLLFAQYASKGE